MGSIVVSIPAEQIAREIANYTIGFARLVVEGKDEDAISAGSGTLCVVDQVYGVVTAAHVLDALPNTGKVGIVRYQGETARYQKQTIDMEGSTKLIIRADEFGMRGPDLGFLRLPTESLGWLKAINSFYDMRKNRNEFIAGTLPANDSMFAVVGMIDERTKYLPPEREKERRKGFEAIFADGDIVSGRESAGFMLMDFVPTSYPNFELPGSFEGTSGGAVWRLFLKMVEGQAKIVAKRHWGVPFYQRKRQSKSPVLTCHGPDGIYTALFDSITKRWPKEIT